jgi:phosphopantothenoylcysteine decarboxylase/phosphopantothenate--cysteine ligase
VEPGTGPLASGQSGQGRLAETSDIVDAIIAAVADRPIREPDPAGRPPETVEAREADLEGRELVITAGGTAEPIDPVRFIGNRSTGKAGVALAEAALARGAFVTLIVGHVSVALPAGDELRVVRAESTAEMAEAVQSALEIHADALIMAAAVADYRPVRTAATKLVRGRGRRAGGPDRRPCSSSSGLHGWGPAWGCERAANKTHALQTFRAPTHLSCPIGLT